MYGALWSEEKQAERELRDFNALMSCARDGLLKPGMAHRLASEYPETWADMVQAAPAIAQLLEA